MQWKCGFISCSGEGCEVVDGSCVYGWWLRVLVDAECRWRLYVGVWCGAVAEGG